MRHSWLRRSFRCRPKGEQMSNLRANLLVVDDQALIRTCLSEVLTKHGYGVRSAPDGFSALAEIRKEAPDLIVSDLNMPRMSGFELLSVIRRRFPSIPVIAMSSAFPGEELPLGVAADAFYQKGVDPGFLLRMVEEITLPQECRPVDRPRLLAPIWIPTNGHDFAGESYVMVSCSECLRAFPEILGEDSALIHHTVCPNCHNAIQYAIVHSAGAA
jgi:CheY-like chemotaxis protein